MLRDSQKIMGIYKRYLEASGDLTEILEQHYNKLDIDNEEIKEKRKNFVKHAMNFIAKSHEDVHILFI